LHFVAKTISILKKDLSVPLIGFCGGPFTVASYLVEKGGKEELKKTRELLSQNPASFHKLLSKITKASIDYLKLQIEAGVNAIQIFDSWAGLLPPKEFQEFSLKYLEQILEALKETKIPLILFCRGSCTYLNELSSINPSAISFDWHKEMREIRNHVPTSIAVQGNLNPDLLRSSKDTIQKEVQKLLSSMRGEKGFIVNLGHGVFPDIPVENVRCFVETVKEFV
jgi:uroporphyrinogen decarboxylase